LNNDSTPIIDKFEESVSERRADPKNDAVNSRIDNLASHLIEGKIRTHV